MASDPARIAAWVERHYGYGIARAYAGHTDSTGPATTTYVKADLHAAATALAALTGQPHPSPNAEHTIVVDDQAPAAMAATAVWTALAEGRRVIFSPAVSEERGGPADGRCLRTLRSRRSVALSTNRAALSTTRSVTRADTRTLGSRCRPTIELARWMFPSSHMARAHIDAKSGQTWAKNGSSDHGAPL